MRKYFTGLLAPPRFEDDDKQRSARFANVISLGLILIHVLLLGVRIGMARQMSGATNAVLFGLALAMWRK